MLADGIERESRGELSVQSRVAARNSGCGSVCVWTQRGALRCFLGGGGERAGEGEGAFDGRVAKQQGVGLGRVAAQIA